MSESRKRLLIDLGIGLLAVVVCAVWFDLFLHLRWQMHSGFYLTASSWLLC